jgi:hypothetical protein
VWLTNAPVENVDWVPVPSNNGILQKNIDSGQIQSDASRRAESQGGFEIWAHRQQCFTSMHLQAVCQFVAKQVQGFILMRTNVVIDDDLMESALKLSGLKTKKDANEFSHFFLFH